MQVAGAWKVLKKRCTAVTASAFAPWPRDYDLSWMAPVVSNHYFQRLQAAREDLHWLRNDIHSVISHRPEGRRFTRFWKSQSLDSMQQCSRLPTLIDQAFHDRSNNKQDAQAANRDPRRGFRRSLCRITSGKGARAKGRR